MKKLILIIAFLFIASASFADSVTLQNGTDSYTGCTDTHIDRENPTDDNSADTTLEIKDRPGDDSGHSDHVTLMSWDIDTDDVPNGSVITSVVLELKIKFTGTTKAWLYQASHEDWVASEANWTLYKTGSSWGTAGARNSSDINGADYGTGVGDIGSVSFDVGDDETYVSFTSDPLMVIYAQANIGDTIHLVVHQNLDDDVSTGFDSCDSGTSDAPKLTITFTPPPDPLQRIAVTVGGTKPNGNRDFDKIVSTDESLDGSTIAYYYSETTSCTVDDDGLLYCPVMPDTGGTANFSESVFTFNKDTLALTLEEDIADSKDEDHHNYGTLCVGDDGYLHMFYGGHSTQLFYKKSTNPKDITAWGSEVSTAMGTATKYGTYPQAFCHGNNPYVFYRGGPTQYIGGQHEMHVAYNTGSWQTPIKIVDWDPSQDPNIDNGSDPRVYAKCTHVNNDTCGDKVYCMFMLRNDNTTDKADFVGMHYFYIDLDDMKVYDADDNEFTLPINYNDADAIFDTSNYGFYRGDVMVDPDTCKNWVVFVRQTTGTNWFTSSDVWVADWNGSSWDTLEIINDNSWERIRASMDSEVMTIIGKTGGNITTMTSTDGDTWTTRTQSSGAQAQSIAIPVLPINTETGREQLYLLRWDSSPNSKAIIRDYDF